MKGKICSFFLGVMICLIFLSCTQEKVAIKVGSAYPKASEITVIAEKFAELVTEYSKGTIEVEVLSGGTIGGDNDILDALKIGSVEVMTTGLIPVFKLAKEYSFLSAPFIFKDYDHFKKVWASNIGKQVVDKILSSNVRVMGIYYRGMRHMTSSKPINNIEDLDGLKLRTPQSSYLLKIYKALGTTPIAISLPELYNALKNGAAEASEGPASQLTAYKLNEVQEYLIYTAHYVSLGMMCINEAFLDKLSSKNRDIIEKAASDAIKYGDTYALNSEESLLKELVASGMTAITPDTDAFRAKATNAIEELFNTDWNVTTWGEINKYQ
jgi:tripartite ATP-independent transporter DctP family solute receptor